MRQPSHQPHLVPGARLGEWIIDAPLGAGPFATLYAGHGAHLGEPVVVKEYFPAAVARRLDGRVATLDAPGAGERYAEALERFVVQARLLRGLCEHKKPPHIAAVRSVIKANNTAYLVMAKADGAPLGDPTQLGAAAAETLIRQLGAALAFVHEAGVVHGHIIPDNILVDADGEPTLIGFGSIRFDTGDAERLTPFTPPYAALEQYVSAYPQGPWTDIYALGVIAYQAITGQTPPEVIGRTGSPRNRKLVAGDWPGVPRPLLVAVDAAMQIAPEQRPQSIAAWLAMLDADDAPPEEIAPTVIPAQSRADAEAAVLMPLFPVLAVAAPAADTPPHPAPPQLRPLRVRWRGMRRLAARHRVALVTAGATLTVGATALVVMAAIPSPAAAPAPHAIDSAAVPVALSPAAIAELAAARDRHGAIVRHADAQAKAVAADLWTLRDRTRMLPPAAAAPLLARADATQAAVDGALARLNDTTRRLAVATSPADTAALIETAAAAGRDIDAERRMTARRLAEADAAARAATDVTKLDTQRAALDRALAEARQVQVQVGAALGSAGSPALRARAAEAGASLDRQAKLSRDPNASREALRRATRSAQASRKTLSALLSEANRPVAASPASAVPAVADEAMQRLARQATRAYDDVNREYMALRGLIERAYQRRPANDPGIVAAYAAATEVHRGLLDLAPRRDAVAVAPGRADAEGRLAELKAALKPLDRRLDTARRALQR